MTTVTLTAQQTQGLEAELGAYNAANPDAPLTLDQFVQALAGARADAAIHAYGAIPVFVFVQRFTTDEYGAVKQLAQTDPIAASLLQQLTQVEGGMVHLWKDTVQQGLGYLVSKSILTSDRAAAIGAITFGG